MGRTPGRRLWWPSILTKEYWKIYAAILKKKIQKEKICSHKNDEFENEKPVRTNGN